MATLKNVLTEQQAYYQHTPKQGVKYEIRTRTVKGRGEVRYQVRTNEAGKERWWEIENERLADRCLNGVTDQVNLYSLKRKKARLASAVAAPPKHTERVAVSHDALNEAAYEWARLGTTEALARLEAEFAKCQPAATAIAA